MIKGAERKMIVVKTTSSSVFEEAYFVVRREAVTHNTDMIAEANKIIDSCGGGKNKNLINKLSKIAIRVGCFLSGGIVGAAIAVLCSSIA